MSKLGVALSLAGLIAVLSVGIQLLQSTPKPGSPGMQWDGYNTDPSAAKTPAEKEAAPKTSGEKEEADGDST
ncbi:hypothetical protein Pan216_29310 [Planctomycetes bacterium Pan216]|uniref:Uncharacterized protein n=1 Tax=Kolteria novifilia TaxID=2527975 RepID=A0A518B510_9BACT|nr:hypothetical protein Pan216_29310 [Planctomycetes bacterium Pan216]